MAPEAARNLRVEDDLARPRARLRAVPEAPAEPRRRRPPRRAPASSWGDLDWTPARGASPGHSDGGEPPVGERLADPFAVEPLGAASATLSPEPELLDEGPESFGEAREPAPDNHEPLRAASGARRTVRITGQPTPARRRSPAAAQISSRPDRVALWAVVLGLFLVFMAAATARAGWSHATLGERTLGQGSRGSDVVTLQRVLRMKGYSISVDGIFGRGTKRTVKRFQRRRRLRADGRVGPLTTRALAATWNPRTATIFGPGLYGNRTACGQTLAHRTRGLAHRRLGCGSRVAVYHAGRIVVLPVIDRGPFSDGVAFDVTEAAGRKLGMSATTRIRAGY